MSPHELLTRAEDGELRRQYCRECYFCTEILKQLAELPGSEPIRDLASAKLEIIRDILRSRLAELAEDGDQYYSPTSPGDLPEEADIKDEVAEIKEEEGASSDDWAGILAR